MLIKQQEGFTGFNNYILCFFLYKKGCTQIQGEIFYKIKPNCLCFILIYL